MSDCPTRAWLAPRRPASPVRLDVLAARIVAGLPAPKAARPSPDRTAGPAHRHPLVRAVVAAFPGARILAVRETDHV